MPRIRLVLMVLFAVACSAVAASEPMVEELNRRLSDEDTSKVADAVEALGKLGAAAGPAIPKLVTALGDQRNTPRMRQSIPGGFEVPLTVSSLAYESLKTIGEPAVPALVAELSKKRRATRRSVMFLLLEIGAPAAPALPELVSIIQSKGRKTLRVDALIAWSRITPKNAEALEQLIPWIDDRDPEFRSYATEAVGEWKESGAPAVPALSRRLADDVQVFRMFADFGSSSPICEFAAKSLGQIGPKANDAIPNLTDLMQKTPDSGTRVVAALAICQIDLNGTAGIETLIQEIKEDNGNAADALGELGPRAASGWEPLVAMSRDPRNEWKRSSAIRAMTRIDGDRVLDILIAALRDDSDDYVRRVAAECLGQLGEKAVVAVPVLIHELENKDHRVQAYDIQTAIAKSLGQIGPAAREAIPQLEKLIDSDAGDWTKEIAREAIRRIRDAPPRPSTEALKP